MCHLIFFLPVFALPVFWFFPLKAALAVYLIICGLSAFIYFKIFQAMRLKPRTGKNTMLGKTCRVIRDIAPDGKIQYGTEIWNATANGKRIPVGEKVTVHGFQGLTVQVVAIAPEKNQ